MVVLGATLFIGARRIGPTPALGAFLEPAHGAWSLARSARLAREASVRIPGLSAGEGRLARRGPGGAAELLGLKPSTLRSRMQKLGVARPAR